MRMVVRDKFDNLFGFYWVLSGLIILFGYPGSNIANDGGALVSPRATMQTFINAMDSSDKEPEQLKTALMALDLTAFPEEKRQESGIFLAKSLRKIMRLTRTIKLDQVSSSVQGDTYQFHRYAAGSIFIAHQKNGEWRFTKDSLERVPVILAALESAKTHAAVGSPRATVKSFVDAMKDVNGGKKESIGAALATLDLSFFTPAKQAERGRELALLLDQIIRLTGGIDIDKVAASKTGKPYSVRRYPQGDLVIALHNDGKWLFTKPTLERLPAILAGIKQPKQGVSTVPRTLQQAENEQTNQVKSAIEVAPAQKVQPANRQEPESVKPVTVLKPDDNGSSRAKLMTGLAPIATNSAIATHVQAKPVTAALKSPRATMRTFIAAMTDVQKHGKVERKQDVLATLELSHINALVRKERGWGIAEQLLAVIDRTQKVDLNAIPDYEVGAPYRFHSYLQGNIEITKQNDGAWLFTQETNKRIAAILLGRVDYKRIVDSEEEGSDLPLHTRIQMLVPTFLGEDLLGLAGWQWIALVVILIAGIILDQISCFLLRIMVAFWRKRHHDAYHDIADNLLRPLGLMLMAAVWWSGLSVINLAADTLAVLLVGAKFLASLSGVWGTYRLADLIGVYLMDKASKTKSRVDVALAPLATKFAKIIVTILGIIFIANNINVDITHLLAGLGLGGLAFALAAKDVVGNLLGSVTILTDHPFHIGDWVKIGEIEGTVESIGFRSTKIRTFYNSLVTVPNAAMITSNIDNMGSRYYRRHSFNLSIAYTTPPERIETFCEGIRELVRLHPYMRKDYFQVYFYEFAAASLEILVYVFWKTPDWSTELREKHRFMLDILRLASRLEVEFAYPTQTIYLKRDEGGAASSATRDFAAVEQQATLFKRGRDEAEAIVKNTTGLGVVPPPVTFSR